MTPSEHEHLNLARRPFAVVPSQSSAEVWIGRDETQRELRKLVRTASRVEASQLILMWASFGQGKTHALRHLEFKALQSADLIPLYVVIPRGIKSFVDIYRAIADALLDAAILAPAGRDLFDRTHGNLTSDVERAIVRIAMYDDDDARIARAYLRGERVHLRQLDNIGISGRIESADDAIKALNQVISVLQRDGSVKILLLLDEVQELEELGKKLTECVGGLHKVFDRNTSALTMVLSFTTGTQAALRSIIGEALFDRASQVLTLPELTVDEGIELVEGLLTAWSIDEDRAPYPFTQATIKAVVERIQGEVPLLTPRSIIRSFDGLLREADIDIEDGVISEIDEQYALSKLNAREE
jgi:hypothetical protein